MRALTDERSNARGGVWRSPGPVAGNDDMGANDSADADGKCHNSNEDDTIGRMSETNNDNLWPAPTADGPLNATVTIPGSKSLSNRYLILAVLGAKPVTLVGLLRSRDTELMMGALSALGVRCDIDPENDTTVTVTPPESGRFSGNVGVYCGLAGTVMRFVPGLALFADAPVRFDGDDQAYARPMQPVLDGLEQLGARVEYHGEHGRLPFTITPPRHDGEQADDGSAAAKVSIDSSGSSQFISGLLLIGSRLPGGLELRHTGEKTPSLPHIRMTVADVNGASGNATADEESRVWRVGHAALQLPERVVSGDGHVHGLGDFDLTAAGEIAPSLAAILAFADAPTRMLGIGHLRGHETNRLEALVTEITRIGGEARELEDGIEITPVPVERLHGEVMESYADHRMATFAAMIGLAVPGVRIVNVETTRKTLPDFVGMWTGMLER